MKASPPNRATFSSAPRAWLLVVLLLTAGVTQISFQRLSEARKAKPAPASVPRFRLEQRGGRLYRTQDQTPFSGWVTDHYQDGRLKLRSAVVDGRLHGISEGWFTNGVMELRESFQEGVPHGTRTTWYANGRKRSEGQVNSGRQQGIYRQWHEDGSLAAEAEFNEGKPHGLSLAWYPSGFLKAEALMKDGGVLERHFYPDGVRREPSLPAQPPAAAFASRK